MLATGGNGGDTGRRLGGPVPLMGLTPREEKVGLSCIEKEECGVAMDMAGEDPREEGESLKDAAEDSRRLDLDLNVSALRGEARRSQIHDEWKKSR